jgi:2-keto-4-pentenoate hydratase/2-oxohepta-3-ene-1,7-dioic acid hydratase in catechol pathway
MMDWEAELGVVIGTRCAEVPEREALGVVAGYINFNDLSARDWLAERPPVGVDWVRHKGFDGFAPCGPYIVPARFVPDPQTLAIRLTVNGVVKQASNTHRMVFGVAQIIEHLTSIMTLYPGDIIATGTPAGVGHGMTPPQYLQAGDVVELEIGPLGRLVTPIV